ncbi:MAG: HAD family hydrolase [Bacillota bacterium]|nr:HAD family hydrolase [Bacillota bacterium]
MAPVTGSSDAAPPLRGVIFDLGGTLMRADGHWEAFLAPGLEALRAYAAPRLSPAEGEALLLAFERLWRATWQEYNHDEREVTAEELLAQAMAEAGLTAARAEAAGFEPARALDAFFEPELHGWRPLPGAVDLLRTLRAEGLRVGLVSNASRHRFVLQVVERFGFAPYLDPVVSSAAFGRRKPARAIFQHVLDRWRLRPEEVAMVGDLLPADVEGARRAGIRAIWLTQVPNAWNDPYVGRLRPEAEAGTLAEVLAILRRWREPSQEATEAASGGAS